MRHKHGPGVHIYCTKHQNKTRNIYTHTKYEIFIQ